MGSLYHFLLEQLVLALVEAAAEKKKTTINLSHFEMTAAPPHLFSLKDVTRLYLNNNKLTDISGISHLTNLSFLALDYNNLQALPQEIKHLNSDLTCLNVSYNPLHTLLPEIGQLEALSVLWLNHCQLSELPAELGSLPVLETFGARGNFIRCLPNEFCKLRLLRWLTLEGNLIAELPQDFNKLGLIHLNLNKNCFEIVPESIQHLPYLKYCFLAYNNIKEVPRALLKEVKHIKKLDLHGNEGLHITSEMKSFRNLQLDENCLSSQLSAIATAILDSPLESIIEEEISEYDSELSTDEDYEDSDSEEDDSGVGEIDWEESVASSELDLSELSEGEAGIIDPDSPGRVIAEVLHNMLTSIPCYVISGC